VSLRGLAVLLLVLGLLAVAVVRLRGPKEEEKPAAPDTPVLAAFDEAKVRAVRTACGETSYELRSGPASGWRLAAPYAAEADPREVKTMLSALHDARVRKVISSTSTGDAAFGLGQDACTVRLEIEGDAAGRTLTIGRGSPGRRR
jgi:hypothetical protein